MGKRGPAPNGEYVGQTAVLSTRITPELRERLVQATEESGKTLSREIEHRLRRTFIEDDKISEAFGNRRNYALMRVISMVLEMWHNPADLRADWTTDPTAYEQVCRKIAGVLKALKPAGPAKPLSDLEQMLADATAKEHPAVVLNALQKAPDALPIGGRRREQVLSLTKSDLGEMASRPAVFKGTAEEMRAEADRLDGKSEPEPKGSASR